MRRPLAAAIVAVALLGACSSDNDDSADGPTSTEAASNSTVTTTPAGTAAQSTTTKVAGPTKLTSAEQAASHLFLAWRSGNRTEARQFAEEAAVNELFSHPPNGPEPTFEGCDQQQAGRFNCAYRYEGGAMIFYVEGGASAGYRVVSLDYIAD